MDEKEFELTMYLTANTIDRALANIKLLERASELLGPGNPDGLDDISKWQADYERSK